MGFEIGGLLGLLIMIIDIWAIIKVAQSQASTVSKIIWIAVILLLPVLGLIIWYFVGPKG